MPREKLNTEESFRETRRDIACNIRVVFYREGAGYAARKRARTLEGAHAKNC
jgi:hypothetical protein